ncbi:MAG: alpha/beta hydrolase [Solirubrobacterales bacterium]|nr:alpha/beta hydrolase [Solirubrobacterales bacterium]
MLVAQDTITLDEAPIFLRRSPSAGTPALYLHGVPTSSDDWLPALELTGGLAPDLIGFGRSAKGGHLDYSLEGHANFVERLLDAVGVERVKLVAHDWGAAGGLMFAQRHPERVERVVLINALPLLSGFRWHRLGRAWRRPLVGELLMGATIRSAVARALRRGSVAREAWPDAAIDSVWQQFDQGTQRAILRLYRDADEERLAAAGARLGMLEVPALVLWGTEDPWLSPELGRAYADLLPGARLELVQEAGHWPWLDQPELIERVAAFLTE